MSPCIHVAFKFFLTAIHPDTSCHKKCFILGGHHTFQHKSFNGGTEGTYSGSGRSLSGYTFSTLYPDLIVYLPLIEKCQPFRSSDCKRLRGKLSMIFASYGSTRVRITCEFQVLDSALIRESTVKSG